MSVNRILFVGTEPAQSENALKSLCPNQVRDNGKYQYGLVNFDKESQLQMINVRCEDCDKLLRLSDAVNNLGLILLVDNASDSYLERVKSILISSRTFCRQHGVAIGVVNRRQMPAGYLTRINEAAKALDICAPIFEVDTDSREDLAILLEALLISNDYLLSRLH